MQRVGNLRHLPVAGLVLALVLALAPLPVLSEGRSIIVLDASGSMWGQIDGQTKLDIARISLNEVLKSMPADTELGLIAYGHREKGSCDDIELIVPPAAGTAQAIADAAARLQFVGKTPLTEAVRRAAVELRSTEEKATVILITDGLETCNADPCALGLELEASGVDFTAHVVGFGLTEDEGRQVSCLATNTGGLYITASDMAGLTDALQTTVLTPVDLGEPEPQVAPAPAPAPAPEPAAPPLALAYNFAPNLLFAAGKPVPASEGAIWQLTQIAGAGTAGAPVITFYGAPQETVPPGSYALEVRLDEAITTLEVTIAADAVFAQDLVLNAGRLIVHPRASAGGPVESGASVALTLPDRGPSTYYGETDVIVPATGIDLKVTLGTASVSQKPVITAGETTEIDAIIGAGVAVVDAYYIAGLKVEGGAHAVSVEAAQKALDGTRLRLDTQYGEAASFALPPGEYVAIVSADLATFETPFSITTGQRAEVAVILNAGVMAVSMPGATSVEVYAGKADIKGGRALLLTEYTDSLTKTAPAGDYLIKVYRGEVVSQAAITIKAGERAELVIP